MEINQTRSGCGNIKRDSMNKLYKELGQHFFVYSSELISEKVTGHEVFSFS